MIKKARVLERFRVPGFSRPLSISKKTGGKVGVGNDTRDLSSSLGELAKGDIPS